MNRFASLVTLLTVLLAGVPEPPSAPDLPAWAWQLPACVGYRAADFPAQHHRVAATVRDGGYVTEVTEVYEAGWAVRAVAEIHALVAACEHYEHGGYDDPAAFREQHRVVAVGFAGDESLLVETVRLTPPGPMRTWYAAAVRHGDVLTTVRAGGAGPDQIWRRIRAGRVQPPVRLGRD